MKGSLKKTTVLSLCVVLGLTIGIGSAFGQKLADQSQIKGEKPIDQPDQTIKKDMIPEHLKPNNENSPQTNSPQVKGEKPLDGPKIPHVQQRLAPEVQEPNTHKDSQSDRSQEKESTKSTEKENQEPSNQDTSKQQDHKSSKNDNSSNSDLDPSPEKNQEREQPPIETPDEQKSQEESSPQKDSQSQSEKQFIDEDTDQNSQEKFSTSQDKEKTDIEIPEMKIEKSNGETVDVTSIIEDIFGDVKSSKEETEKIQGQIQSEQLNPKVAQHNQLNKEPKVEEPKQQEISTNNPPRTIKHGTMPMTASNDLQGVLIGLVIAAVGILFVLFRKGEPR